MKNRASIEKPFKIADIAVYVLLAAVVAACFSAGLPNSSAKIAEVTLKGEIVARIYLDDRRAEVYGDNAVKKSDNVIIIQSEAGFNEITVDFDARFLKITDSDCAGKECVHMDLDKGAIICAPHSLVIKLVGKDDSVKVG